MIVNWKKPGAGALVLPCMKDGLCLKKITLLPGHNEIDTEDWLMARDQCKRHIGRGLLEALEKIEVKEPVKADKVATENDTKLELIEESFPAKAMIVWLRENDHYEGLALLKKEQTGKKPLSKDWMIPYFTDNPELWEDYLGSLEVVGKDISDETETKPEETITAITLQDMEVPEAVEVIKETYNLETLEKWKSETGVESMRLEIMNQIELVNKPPEGDQK